MEKTAAEICIRCWKPKAACICASIEPLAVKTRVLVLQHPQESKELLGTARLLTLSVAGAKIAVGLSWPSLKAALKETEAQSKDWAVLFVGTQKDYQSKVTGPMTVIDRKNQPVPLENVKGLVLLDGSWAQSKTLWWRNAWLLKLNRIVLNPKLQSLYGDLRREPRRGCLSTLEAAAYCLAEIENREELLLGLSKTLQTQLDKIRSINPRT